MNGVSDKILKMTSHMVASDAEALEAKVKELIEDGTYSTDFDFHDLRKALLDEDFEIELNTGAHMQIEFPAAEKMLPYIVERRWNVLRAKEGSFVTSDAPVVLHWAAQWRHALRT